MTPPPASRVALVTGAARGIGGATVRALCDQGYRVVAVDSTSGSDRPDGVDYDLARPEDLASVERAAPGQVLGVRADVRVPAEVQTAVDLARDRFGRLDAVVAAAGIITGGALQWRTPVAHLTAQLDVNLVGVWHTAAAALPVMLESTRPDECRFVAVASAAGQRGLFSLSAYNASKHAVIGLVRGLAADLVGTGVTAVAVSPGSTRTDMLSASADIYGLADREALAEHQLIRRLIDPAEVAATLAFCCSPAAGILNGSVVSAEGGFCG